MNKDEVRTRLMKHVPPLTTQQAEAIATEFTEKANAEIALLQAQIPKPSVVQPTAKPTVVHKK